MDSEQSTKIIIFLICLLLSAFFSASETALLSVNKIRMRSLSEEGDSRAKVVERLLSNTDQLISTLLVGNNLVNILASSLSTAIAIDIFGDKGVGIATGIVTLLILIFSEITPKSLASRFADGIALSFGGIISVLITLFKPVVVVLNFISGIIIRLLAVNINRHLKLQKKI